MPQHNYNITSLDAFSGIDMRAAINAALQALAGNNSGATAPVVTYPYMIWADTTAGRWKVRNAADTAWIDRGPLANSYSTFSDPVNEAMGANVASAGTVNLNSVTGNTLHITGTTTIAAITLAAGCRRQVIFDSSLVLAHHAANNNLPGGVNIITAPGDRALYISDGTRVYCMFYQRSSPLPVFAPVRQCVVSGAVDSNNAPDFIVIKSGLTITIKAGLVMTFANGVDGDYQVVLPVDTDVTIDTDSPTRYICAVYSTATGVVTFQDRNLAHFYQPAPPAAPSSGQRWFDTLNYQMYYRDDTNSAWVPEFRLFIGEAAVSGGSITSLICYAPLRRSMIIGATTAGSTVRNHNLGFIPGRVSVVADGVTLNPAVTVTRNSATWTATTAATTTLFEPGW